jgi:hypothetical protein
MQRVNRLTTQGKPRNATHWPTRTMAAEADISEASVRRMWRAHDPKPHLVQSFKVTNDPQFSEKLPAIVGLHLNPPEHALVLNCDEKSPIQALDRSQPGLPLKPCRAGIIMHDYKRNGAAALFAALNVLGGTVFRLCQGRLRHQDCIKFLRLVDDVTSADTGPHVIVDNYATYNQPKVQRWLKRHPLFQVHFTLTSTSCPSMIERFFPDLTKHRLRRRVFRDVVELIMAINQYVPLHQEPEPFIWTTSATDILENVKRSRGAPDHVQSV